MPNIVWPWGVGVQQDPTLSVQPTVTESYGPFLPPNLDSGEFAPLQFIKTTVSKVTANADRLFQANKGATSVQSQSPAWYDIPGRLAATASAVNDAFQSTLIKILVLAVIVGAAAIFGLSYVQAKGTNLAK
jgi:hypothetical protein